MSLAVVILNYNGRGFLSRFLPAVIDHADGAAIYVADNGSTDGSINLLRTQFPTVRVIELPTNEGYAGGYNKALEHISHHPDSFTYYCLLNSDVAVTPGWIRPIVTLLDANPRMAACQPKLLAYDEPTQFEYAGGAGGYLDWLGFAFCRGRLFDTLETDAGQYDDDRPVFWASGACLFVRASVFHQTGGFDASFFAHMEEIDWCWRVQRQGYEIWTCGAATVHHVGAGTLAKSNPKKTYLNYRNSLAMLYKNVPGRHLWGLLFL
ncbi:MAG TPA: glycosyltransferase family 2 protein, partial [Fibrella sp.]